MSGAGVVGAVEGGKSGLVGNCYRGRRVGLLAVFKQNRICVAGLCRA